MNSKEKQIIEDLTQIGRAFEKKIKTALKEDKTREVAQELKKLNEELKKISPEHLKRKMNPIERMPEPVKTIIPTPIRNIIEKMLQMPMEKVLETITENYETVGEAIKDIELFLLKARDNLMLDIEEMKIFRKKLESFTKKIEKRINWLKEETKKLEEKKKNIESKNTEKDTMPEELEIKNLIFSTLQEIQDLETIKQAIGQGIISIHQIINTNTALINTIERTIRVSKVTVYVGIMIRQAISSQSKAIKGVQQTQEFASNLILDNAKAIGNQTEEIKNLYTSPVLALDKVQQAYEELIKAMQEFENVKEKGYKIANENIQKLEKMNRELKHLLQTTKT